MVFKMSSQSVRCKRVRRQVRFDNNPRFYFSTRDVAKTAWMHFVKSILMHSLSLSMRAKTCILKERSDNIYNFVKSELTVKLSFGSIFVCFAFQIRLSWLRSSIFQIAKKQYNKSKNSPITFRLVDNPPFFFAV